MDSSCVTYRFDGCLTAQSGGCHNAYLKTKLKPIKITADTAKLVFNVPRQSSVISPLSSGWTMKVKYAGTNKVIAEYQIADYDHGNDGVVFFIDDAVRGSKKGYYLAEVYKDCCPIAKVAMHIDCEKATKVDTINFTHDPMPLGCSAQATLKPAECEVACKPAPVDVCKGCETC